MNNCYSSVGFMGNINDIELLERILLYNYNTISKFNYIVVKNTFSSDVEKYSDDYNNVWKKIYGNDIIILQKTKNRGHTTTTTTTRVLHRQMIVHAIITIITVQFYDRCS